MTRQVRRAYKHRFYPTGGQATELARTFGCARKVCNLALEARTVASVSVAARMCGGRAGADGFAWPGPFATGTAMTHLSGPAVPPRPRHFADRPVYRR